MPHVDGFMIADENKPVFVRCVEVGKAKKADGSVGKGLPVYTGTYILSLPGRLN